MLDPQQLRQRTRAKIAELGYPDPPVHFPVLWEPNGGYSVRPIEDIASRAAVLNVIVALSFGMPPELAMAWVSANGIEAHLSATEAALVRGEPVVGSTSRQTEVEAIWALAWVLSLGEELSPAELCPEDLVRRVPNLRDHETLEAWRFRVAPALRPADEVMAALDLYYCLTWGLAEANLRQHPAPGAVDQYVIWQRRRALEFAMAERRWAHEEWDNIDLST